MWLIIYVIVAISTFILCTLSDWLEFEEILVGDIVTNILVGLIPVINMFVMGNHLFDWLEIWIMRMQESTWYKNFRANWNLVFQKQIIKKKDTN